MQGPIDVKPSAQEAPEPEAPSAKQRLRLHVPYLKTTMTMGEAAAASKIRSEDAGDMNFPGFGVTTQGHVFVDANGAPPTSMMRLQSTGPLTVQSHSTVAIGGQISTVLASNGPAICAGGGGIALLGGDTVRWHVNQVNNGKSPDAPEWIGNIKSSVSNFTN